MSKKRMHEFFFIAILNEAINEVMELREMGIKKEIDEDSEEIRRLTIDLDTVYAFTETYVEYKGQRLEATTINSYYGTVTVLIAYNEFRNLHRGKKEANV